MLVSDSKKFVFIHIYKTGGTSVQKMLEKYDRRFDLTCRLKLLARKATNSDMPVLARPYKHANAEKVRTLIGADCYDSYFKFAFVRNPWDWQVSLYYYMLRSPDTMHPQVPLVKSMENFDRYIRWRCREEVRLQYNFIYVDGKLLVDFVGRYENFQLDFDKICDRLDIARQQLPKVNTTKRDRYRDYYTPETRLLVSEAFSVDIETFGYEF